MSEGSWAGGLEYAAITPVAGTGDSADDGELESAIPVEVRTRSADIVLGLQHGGSDDRNGVGRGSVVAAHFLMELADGSVEGDVSVLLVHVVDGGP